MGKLVKEGVELQDGGMLAVFQPDLPLRLGEKYSASVAGTTDLAGNPVQSDTTDFTLFEPQPVSSVLSELGKCLGDLCAPEGAQDVTHIGETMFIANGLGTGADETYADPANPKRLIVMDLGNPDA